MIRITIHLIRYTMSNAYRRYISYQIYDVTQHIFDKLVVLPANVTEFVNYLSCACFPRCNIGGRIKPS